MDHTSAGNAAPSRWNTSGAVYDSVPAGSMARGCSRVNRTAVPKSHNFTVSCSRPPGASTSSKFSVFRSRCTISSPWRYATACSACRKMVRATGSSKPLPVCFALSAIRSYSSPPRHNSITIQQRSGSSKASNILTMFGCSRPAKMDRSCSKLAFFVANSCMCSNESRRPDWDLGKHFAATHCCARGVHVASNTSPYMPSPRRCSSR
mmetsp:Transcript_125528/g.363224  ORF Transcript_125528/g.363224 Transcript_125528/m.363224 type:complete len:207 (-) Transcript_125528:378-998(-)